MVNKRQRDKLKKKGAEGEADARAALDRQSERNNERSRDYYGEDQPRAQSPPRRPPPAPPGSNVPSQSRGISSSHGVTSPHRPRERETPQDEDPNAGTAYGREPAAPPQQQPLTPHAGPAKGLVPQEVTKTATNPTADFNTNKRVAVIVE
ncbi:hypothetical protein ST47_g9205 [Ascochyta rabiei]|uniref:Uncharacterized protein n=1 Tax=Didymella rabiei TaxID=5454 RepID=A0A162XKH6_DIDRA|nr:hypothetical protein ST47_g9205 [Ascochyta rabiei]